tara:strand:- start:995 stop:1666 length:672 start_codon:yes stop_codon:yes gene_type:complete
MKVIVVIPARKGSLRLPNKNRKKLLGKPLIDWTIDFAKRLKFVDDVIVSTNDKIIVNKIKKHKIVKTFIRPHILSGKKTKTVNVILHLLKRYEKNFGKVEAVLLLQPTSPIRSLKKLQYAFKKYKYFKRKKSVMSVSKTNSLDKKNYKIKNNNLLPLNCKNKKKFSYQANGNFYIASPLFLRKHRSFYFKNLTYPIILNSKSLSIDIDTIIDFKMAERAMKRL